MVVLAFAHSPVIQVDQQFFQAGISGTLRPKAGEALLREQLKRIEQAGTGEDGGWHPVREQVGKGNAVVIFPTIVKGNGNLGMTIFAGGTSQQILKWDDMVVPLKHLQQRYECRFAQHQVGVVAQALLLGWQDTMERQYEAAAASNGAPEYRCDPRPFDNGAEGFHFFCTISFTFRTADFDWPGDAAGNHSKLNANLDIKQKQGVGARTWVVTDVTRWKTLRAMCNRVHILSREWVEALSNNRRYIGSKNGLPIALAEVHHS